jgi:hypothetical protein
MTTDRSHLAEISCPIEPSGRFAALLKGDLLRSEGRSVLSLRRDHQVADKEIELRFRYMPGEYARAVRVHLLAAASTHANAVIALLAFATGLLILQRGTPQYFWLGVVFVGLSAARLLYFGYGLLAWRDAAKSTRLQQEYTLRFSDAGIFFSTDDTESRFAWKFYRSARRVGGYYLLHYSRRQFTVIPARVFRDVDQLQDFDDMLRRHLRRVELRP